MNPLEQAIALFTSGQHQAAMRLAAEQLPPLLDFAALGHYEQGMKEQAESLWRMAVVVKPDFERAFNNIGLLCAERGSLDEAEAAFRSALSIQPDYAEALHNLAVLLERLGRLAEAEVFCRRALAVCPGYVDTHFNLANLLREAGRLEEAEAAYRETLALSPDRIDVSLNYAFLLLSMGRFREAWPLQELRYHPARPVKNTIPPDLPFPQWQGEDLQGKRLLVWHEQGFGDEIQFCRLIPWLKARAAHIGWVCKPPLAPLLATLAGLDAVYPADAVPDLSGYDYWTFPLSIPLHCGLSLDTIPASLPYLSALPERLARWQTRLPKSRPRVGLVWKGHGGHGNDARRSLAGLAQLKPLWSVPGVAFVSLQKDAGEEEARQAPQGQPLTHLGSELADFADTAAIVAQLDLVICVDTAIAHLTGALGKPCWLLLTDYRTDWRWLRGLEDSPWYPGLLRLFRQGKGESWDAVIARVAEALREWRDEG